MMEWRTGSKDNTFHFNILLDGEYAVPDAGSLKLTLRDNDGAVMSGYDQLVLADTTKSTLSVVIPAAQNEVGSASFETRYLLLEYTVGEVPCTIKKIYRVAPFLPIQVTVEEVRALIGAGSEELKDEEIDINLSYFLLLDEHGSTFSTALTASSTAGLYANRAIALHTALLVLPAIPLKFRLMERMDNAEVQKDKVDFSVLRKDLEKQLEEALDIALDRTLADTGPTLFSLTTPTDAITGE